MRCEKKVTNNRLQLFNLLKNNERNRDEPQILPWHLRRSFQIIVQHADTDVKIAYVEGIDFIPALWAEFPALRDHRVEVTEGK